MKVKEILDNLDAIWTLYSHRTGNTKHLIDTLFWRYLNGKVVDENTTLQDLRNNT